MVRIQDFNDTKTLSITVQLLVKHMQSNFNVKTKEYSITENQFMKIIFGYYYKKNKWLFLIYAILILVNLLIFLATKESLGLIFVGLIVGVSLLITPWLIYKNGCQNKFVFLKNRVEIETDFVTFYYQDGSLFKSRLANFHLAEKAGEFYFLYLTKSSFYYIPKAAFYTEADIQLFELMLKTKNLLK